ncbi:MAG TPA: RDD family protein [Selenomonadales bacterium]|nr:RDD family protein [Selenomonadales bacterium]
MAGVLKAWYLFFNLFFSRLGASLEIQAYILSPLWFPVTMGIIALIPVAGYAMILFTSRRQGLHDKIAGTLVVLKKNTLGETETQNASI